MCDVLLQHIEDTNKVSRSATVAAAGTPEKEKVVAPPNGGRPSTLSKNFTRRASLSFKEENASPPTLGGGVFCLLYTSDAADE